MCQNIINIAFLKIFVILGFFFWVATQKSHNFEKSRKSKNPHLIKNIFFFGCGHFFWVQKTKKKSQNGHFWHLLFLFFKIPYNLKIPYEWQPWQHRSSNIAYVSAFVNTNPHMKFQKNKKSGSKVTGGDGQTDRRTDGPPDGQTDRRTTRLL